MLIDSIILFIFGVAFGSFFNVVTMRYDGEKFLFSEKILGGRSHCPHCQATLRWYELIPVISFLIQRGKCRRCKAPLSVQYPIVEILTGAIFAFVPLRLAALPIAIFWPPSAFTLIAACWIIIASLLLIMAVIDLRLGIIPDEISIALSIVGIVLLITQSSLAVPLNSWFGRYGNIFGLASPIWLNRIVGAAVGLLFFGGLWLLTRGKGMGLGDVKLAMPLGLIFGWPDIIGLSIAAFIIGAVVGVIAIMKKNKTMRSAIPFGPFLALAAILIFFAGTAIASGYFGMMGM